MEDTLSLEYNSQRPELKISEYGRHIQKLIKYAVDIKDDKERQAFVEGIVNLMQMMNPQTKNVDDYEEKLWRHVFRISDYNLNVKAPEGINVDRAQEEEVELKLEYPQRQFNHRHYGHNVQQLIEKAIAMEDEVKKKEFSKVIAAYMKLAYKTWNKEHHVNDEVIKNDLRILSKGKLVLEEEYNINTLHKGGARHKSTNNRRGRKNRTTSRKGNNNKKR